MRVRVADKSMHRKINRLLFFIRDLFLMLLDLLLHCFLELYPRWSPTGAFKPIVPLNRISFEVADCGVHHGILLPLLFGIAEVLYKGYDGEVLGLESWLRVAIDGSNGLVAIGGQKVDGSKLRFRVDSLWFKLLLVLRFEGAMDATKDFCGSGLRLGRKV
ncbi:hypothetical protein B296_00010068 [Ensete ventricosum]|uniref:Uncharacterized protein n=1 Tax=Ensete ventricosum TaxID=4639 RepID=A0A427B4I4_ENSVE|nr:hypothetical protein B296_00010068 [Ensete ventricosum]